MRFWDASAVVPLLLEQPNTAHARALLDDDPGVVMWWGTPVECGSAISRLRREDLLAAAAETAALRVLERLKQTWYEILPVEQVRAQALRVLRMHPLRAADALQLAAALEWSGTPTDATIVTFDQGLATSAELEGFRVAGLAG